MIVVAGLIDIQPDQRDAAIAAAREAMAATAKEDGCLSYRFYTDIEDENRFHVFEEWASQEALSAHSKSPHLAQFQKRMGSMVAAAPQITRYEVADSGQLG